MKRTRPYAKVKLLQQVSWVAHFGATILQWWTRLHAVIHFVNACDNNNRWLMKVAWRLLDAQNGC